MNGKVACFKERSGISFAEAVAVSDGKIVRVGRVDDLKQLVGPETVTLNLNGRVVLPGFIDTHAHPAMYGTACLFEVNVSKAASIREIIEILHKRAEQSKKGSWIRAYGYDDHKLADRRHPTRLDLDKAAPENPVALRRCCGHMSVMNTQALNILGITKQTKDPDGGVIDRDPASGEPAGLLREKASELAWKTCGTYTVEETKKGLARTFQDLLSWGITTVHDASAIPESIRAYQELKAEGNLPVRVNLMIQDQYLGQDLLSCVSALGLGGNFGDEWIKIMGIKFFADGSVGGHTAALNVPYLGEPKNFGVLRIERELLKERVTKAHNSGFQVCIHAIGDRAIDEALTAIETSLEKHPVENHRHRIEHCGLCQPAQLERIKASGVFVSSSTCFIFEVGDASMRALGEERINWYYPDRSYIDYGITSAENSDLGASATANPFIGIYAMVTRKDDQGRSFGIKQRTTLEEAIRLYTINGALLGFDEKNRGSIEEGKYADLIVLSDDPFSASEERFKDITVDITIVNGKIEYRRNKK